MDILPPRIIFDGVSTFSVELRTDGREDSQSKDLHDEISRHVGRSMKARFSKSGYPLPAAGVAVYPANLGPYLSDRADHVLVAPSADSGFFLNVDTTTKDPVICDSCLGQVDTHQLTNESDELHSTFYIHRDATGLVISCNYCVSDVALELHGGEISVE